MIRTSISTAGAALALLLALSTGVALACQPPPPMSTAELFNQSAGVVRARVTQSRLINVSELGQECTGIHCELLEITLDVSETYKDGASINAIVYSATPYLCVVPVRTGLEYVLFLTRTARFPNAVFVNEYSDMVGHRGQPVMERAALLIAELKELASGDSQ